MEMVLTAVGIHETCLVKECESSRDLGKTKSRNSQARPLGGARAKIAKGSSVALQSIGGEGKKETKEE